MLRSKVKTYRYRIGKKTVIVINIYQSARASAKMGNALASNALNIQIFKNVKSAELLTLRNRLILLIERR